MRALLVALVAFALAACKGPVDPSRDVARGAVLTIVEAVKVADHACAQAIVATRSRELGDACVNAYQAARESSLVAADAVDAWEAGAKGKTACAAKRALVGLEDVSRVLAKAGRPLPAVVQDALASGEMIKGLCHE